jgi:hypothetical protein
LASVWPRRYIARRGATPTSGRIEATCGGGCEVSGLALERFIRARTRVLDDVLADVLRRLAVALTCEEEWAVRPGRFGEIAEEHDPERRDERYDALAPIGLDPRRREAAPAFNELSPPLTAAMILGAQPGPTLRHQTPTGWQSPEETR